MHLHRPALAVDETKEVLIFKMAVALGFDAPRAFTLVSMRGIADADFGTQIVGRIMRVHRRCQGRTLPLLLQNAYVFLADCEAQAGLATAAQKVNQIKTELAKVSPYAVVVQVAGQNQLQIIQNGQTYLLPGEKQLPVETEPAQAGGQELQANEVHATQQPGWLELFGEAVAAQAGTSAAQSSATGQFIYDLRPDVPKVLLTQRMMLGVDDAGLAGGIVRNFRLSEEILLDGMRRAVSVIKVDQAVFIHDETRTRIEAEVATRETEILAQRMLFNMGTVDPRELQSGLLERIAGEYRKRGLEIAGNEDQLDDALALIKAVSDHKSYGRTAILFYEEQKRWKIVRYNEEKNKNEVAELFDLSAAKMF